MPVIRISSKLFKRLERHAKGFDSPGEVIGRLLDAYEGVDPSPYIQSVAGEALSKPELNFFPDEARFRSHLVAGKDGRVLIFHLDGTVEEKTWNSVRFKATSNLRANIWSGYLRGWRENQIVRAEFHAD